MPDDKVIFEDSDEAAKFVDDYRITGWVSRKGNYYGNGPSSEQMARYDGSTHKRCNTCGDVMLKRSFCRPCSDKRHKDATEAEYAALPKKKWNGETPVYSMRSDEWFFNEDEIFDFCDERSEGVAITPADLLLVIGDPVYAHAIDPNKIYQDCLPENGDDVPTEVQIIFDDLNDRLKECKVPLSWTTTKKSFAVDMEGWDHA